MSELFGEVPGMPMLENPTVVASLEIVRAGFQDTLRVSVAQVEADALAELVPALSGDCDVPPAEAGIAVADSPFGLRTFRRTGFAPGSPPKEEQHAVRSGTFAVVGPLLTAQMSDERIKAVIEPLDRTVLARCTMAGLSTILRVSESVRTQKYASSRLALRGFGFIIAQFG